MKKTFTLIAVFGAALALAAVSPAQGAGPQGGAPKAGQGQQGGKRGGGMGRMAKLNKEILAQLNLTADQKAKIEALQQKDMAAMKELRKSMKEGDKEGNRAKMREFHQNHMKSLMAILTPAQQTRYKELRKAAMKKLREEGGQRGRGGKAGKGGAGTNGGGI